MGGIETPDAKKPDPAPAPDAKEDEPEAPAPAAAKAKTEAPAPEKNEDKPDASAPAPAAAKAMAEAPAPEEGATDDSATTETSSEPVEDSRSTNGAHYVTPRPILFRSTTIYRVHVSRAWHISCTRPDPGFHTYLTYWNTREKCF